MQDVQSHSKPSTVKQFVLAIICLRNYRNIFDLSQPNEVLQELQ